MSTTPKTIEVMVTTCDRPRCGRVISEAPAAKGKQQPALVVKRPGKEDIVYQDLCRVCTNATDNLCDRVEKKEEAAKDDADTDTGEEPASGDSHGTPPDGGAAGGGES